MQKKPSHIKHYLKSKTPESLKRLMLDNNVKRQHYFDYVIIHDGQNWFAWYEWDTEALFTDKDLDEDNTIR
jgi:hypothetical protein